ncbi:hypothetical protein HY357_04710, partial [Candidatus Roizmanbacteria bacterium]|nr:hypothetical protein [Candidatus Roizmanbacteria bacterium]
AKKSLAKTISNTAIDDLYMQAIRAGAWGGKILGAGGGGCLLFIVSQNTKANIKKALKSEAKRKKLKEFCEIPFRFVQSGAEILFNADHT